MTLGLVAGPWLGLGALAVAAALLALRLRRWRRRHAEMVAQAARLAAANAALREVAERAEAKARLLDGVLAAMADGVLVVDAELRVAGWNARFPEHAGVPASALRLGMPMEEVVRLQAERGEFGLVDPEETVRARMARLRANPAGRRWQRERPDGTRIELRRAPLPGGGFVTLYTPLAPATPPDDDALALALARDWAIRLPRLTAAAADGDLGGLRAAAHALRGIALNAGWTRAAAQLQALEAAAEGGDLRAARALAATLGEEQPAP